MDKIYSIFADKDQKSAQLVEHTVSSETESSVVLDHSSVYVPKDNFYAMAGKLFGNAMYGDDKERLIEAWNKEMRVRADEAAQNYYPYLLEQPREVTPAKAQADHTAGAPLQACYLTWEELNTLLIPWFAKNFPHAEGAGPEACPLALMRGTGAWEIHLRGAGQNEQLRLRAAELGTAVTIGQDIVFGYGTVNDIVEQGLLPDALPIPLRSIHASVANDGGVYLIGEGL